MSGERQEHESSCADRFSPLWFRPLPSGSVRSSPFWICPVPSLFFLVSPFWFSPSFLVPRGIAATNVEIERTQVAATTIHNLFDFDGDYVSKLDFAKVTQTKVAALIQLQVLLLDEASAPSLLAPSGPLPSGSVLFPPCWFLLASPFWFSPSFLVPRGINAGLRMLQLHLQGVVGYRSL